jgi:aspartyl-tRNA(Asn)/glutamyl-tRNA(Gln) amidotransferase subunit A
MNAPLDHPLAAISARLADGTLRAQALVEAAIERHEPALNAYKYWDPDLARAQAAAADAAFAAGIRLGTLQGIPVSAKDLYGVAGMPTFAGSPRELPPAWDREGPLVAKLRGQLAAIMGKSHTVEFAFGGLGLNAHWPTPWNPADRRVHRAPGGSSSGAGVSLGEGSALLALGTDTAGSVRIPASLTGHAGLKTTKGRWSTAGIVPLSPTLDTAGLLARSVADLAFAFEELDGETVPRLDDLSGVRLAIAESFFWEGAWPGVAERCLDAIRIAEASGARTPEMALPGAAEIFALYQQGGIVAPELYRFLSAELPDWIAILDPRVARRMESGKTLPAWDYLQCKARYDALGAGARALFGGIDALVGPTAPITAPPVSEIAEDSAYTRVNLLALRNTCAASFLGLCALSLPAGRDGAGMPVGLQLIGPPGSESRLLAIGRILERALKTRHAWDSAGI